ncbi:MAG: FtsX-like permease family protein [Lachnospiraceae bacterium]|nr:FtsX-like permease family protein [Lachnospiraceae bacterium]
MLKDTIREIRHSFGRYMAILSIVLLGVAFFAGVSASPFNMRATADRYYDNYRLQDIRLVSTVGFTEDDVEAVRKKTGVRGLYAAHTLDVLAAIEGEDGERVMALNSLPADLSEDNEDYLNRLRLSEGRLPEKEDEIVLRVTTARVQPVKVGDVIAVRSGTSDALSDSLSVNEFTVVGLTYVPTSISFDLGSTAIGNGSVSYIGFVPECAFVSEYYTNLYVTVEGAEALDTFQDEYFDHVAPLVSQYEDLSAVRLAARLQEVREEVLDTVTEEVTKEVEKEARKEVGKAVREEIEKTVAEEVEKGVREAIEEEVRSAVEEKVQKAIGEEVRTAVEKAVKDAIAAQVFAEVESNVYDAMEAEVRRQVEAGVRAEIGKQVRTQVENGVRSAIEKEARTQVEAGVRAAIEKEVREKVEAAVRTGIEEETKRQLSEAILAALSENPMYPYMSEEQKQEAFNAAFAAQYPAALAQAMAANYESTVNAQYPAALAQAMAANYESTVNAQYPAALSQAMTANFESTVNAQYPAALSQALAANLRPAVDAAFPAAFEQALDQQFDRTVAGIYPEALQKALDANLVKEIEKAYPEAYQKALDENLDQAVEDAYPEALEKALEENYDEAYREAYDEAIEKVMKEEYEKTVAEETQKAVDEVLEDEIRKVYDEQIEEIEDAAKDWKWFVLDRNSQASYVEYANASDQMSKIAMIFPVFFFFVAALVCFTTMTRMVDEQRMLIGTYKAMGFSNAQIAMKYVWYALSASLIGGVLGIVLGMRIFPSVVINAWGIAYQMPAMVQADNRLLCILSVISMAAVVTLAALFACLSDVRDVPASLMRPKAPKVGKKVLLERVGFLWKRFSFTQKVTVRNIFRYKKRFIMTLAGVAGCTALLVTGFGISDSVKKLVSTQFSELYRYDAAVTLRATNTAEEMRGAADLVMNDPAIEEALFLSSANGKANTVLKEDKDHKDLSVTITVSDDPVRFARFYTLRQYRTQEIFDLEDGICIAEATARQLGIREGDTFYLENADEVRKEVRVAHIIEFYVGNTAFMSADLYERIFGETPEKNALVFTDRFEAGSEEEDDLGKMFLEDERVSGITFLNTMANTINQMIAALNMITLVLIISSALLSFVVLYNLSNVNISERLREIATLKVLGFYDTEVNAYILRETVTITVAGALFGLGLGVGLHHIIMATIAVENITFGNYIAPETFLYSFALTLLFALIVSFFINAKLKTIPMVESLKSAE